MEKNSGGNNVEIDDEGALEIPELDFSIDAADPEGQDNNQKDGDKKEIYADPGGDRVFSQYLREITKFPVLEREEEIVLARELEKSREKIKYLELIIKKIKKRFEKDADFEDLFFKYTDELNIEKKRYNGIVNKLVSHNLRMVIYVAKRYQGHGLSLMDLVQEGNIGLRHAVTKFDVNRGNKLSTYAMWWILQSIGRAVSDKGRTIKFPVHVSQWISRLLRFEKHYKDKFGKDPSVDEISNHLGVDRKKTLQLMNLANLRLKQLDAPVADNPKLSRLDIISYQDHSTPLETYIDIENREMAEKLLSVLPPRERMVVEQRFQNDLTLNEIGLKIGVTRERVRQIEESAKRKMKRAVSQMGMSGM